MKLLTVTFCSLVVIVVLSLTPVLAQHGRGGGIGGGKGFGMSHTHGGGKGFGMPSSSGRKQGHFGAEKRLQGRQNSKVGKMTGSSTLSGKKNAADLLSRNTKLSSKLQTLLPKGTDMQKAASGFDNLGQFAAATHVSHNLNVPFDDLKTKMTGPSAVSLGQAIHELKPGVDAKKEALKANEQALEDMEKSFGKSSRAFGRDR
ncbi:MAG: hypothetical protein ACE5HC_14475 [Candidatus Binatia bacterium]